MGDISTVGDVFLAFFIDVFFFPFPANHETTGPYSYVNHGQVGLDTGCPWRMVINPISTRRIMISMKWDG